MLFKIGLLKNAFAKDKCTSKLMPQKIHFKTWVHIKIAPSQKYISKLLSLNFL